MSHEEISFKLVDEILGYMESLQLFVTFGS